VNHQITVKDYLSEASDELLKIVDDTIAESKKLHIGAPVGTGKTTFAIDLVKHLGEDYKTIFLFPIIAISEQAQFEFDKRNIDAEIFNSKVKIDDVKDCQVILSTIDSAPKLIDDGFLDETKVLIILDETHTYLQKARENFSKSVEAILKSGYPIIGLSATPSTWVNSYLFGIEDFIDVEVSSYTKKQINPVEVQNGLLRYVAEVVSENEDDKWIIFLERIRSQKALKIMIRELRANSKVAILNSETKKASEAKTWKYLMKQGELPGKVDIAIINSVAQAGISIKNKDIDHVILVDKQDPFGIVQFLGRCREYKGEFDFYFAPGGKYIKQEIDTNYIQQRIDLINIILSHRIDEYKEDLKSILSLLGGNLTVESSGSLVADKCLVATKIYSLLRDASGVRISNEIARLFPKDIIVSDIMQTTGITGSTATQNKQSRDANRQQLVKAIAKNTSLILGFDRYIEPEFTIEDALHVINNPAKGLFGALVSHKPYYKKVKDRKKIRKIIKLADKADRSMQRVIIAATLYQKAGKKVSTLKKYIKTSNQAIDNLYFAKHFFENDLPNNPIAADAIDNLKGMVGDVQSTKHWKNYIRSLLGVASHSDKFVDRIFISCLRFKNKEVYPNISREIHRELIGINKSFDDYLTYKGTLKDFYDPTT